MRLFTADRWAMAGPEVVIVAAFVAAGVWALFQLRAHRGVYSVTSAWQRALVYFAGCWLVGWLTGVLPTLLRSQPIDSDQLESARWWVFALACLVVIVIAYGVIWPRGTLTHGRPRMGLVALGFGLLWGLAQSQLYLAMWSVIERVTENRWIVVLVTFVMISAFTGAWHDRYWDRLVSPDHNIAEWNLRKVLFCHVPNLVITLIFLAVHDNAWLFVAYQTMALMLSAWFMRFPPPTAAVQRQVL